jgi:hypothetical protein
MATTDVSWIVTKLGTERTKVHSVIPDGFEAVVRILHPIRAGGLLVRWSSLHLSAIDRSDVEHQLKHETRFADEKLRPVEGVLPSPLCEHVFQTLISNLRGSNQLLSVLFWTGSRSSDYLAGAETVQIAGESYYATLRTQTECIDDCRTSSAVATPNWCWPQDRSWLVVTEVDLLCTYVATSRQAARMLTTDVMLEAAIVDLNSPLI